MNCRQPKEEQDAQNDRPTCGDRAGDRLTSSSSVGEGEGNLRLQAERGAYVDPGIAAALDVVARARLQREAEQPPAENTDFEWKTQEC